MSFYRCEKCNSSNIRVEKKQSRQADEDTPYFQTCNDCGFMKKIVTPHTQSAPRSAFQRSTDREDFAEEYEREKRGREMAEEYEREKRREHELYGLSERERQKEKDQEFELYYGVPETEKQKEEFLLLLDPFYLDIKEIAHYDGPIPEKETLQSLLSLIGRVDSETFSKLLDVLLEKGVKIDTDILVLEAIRKEEYEFIDIALSLTRNAQRSLSRALSLAAGLSNSEIVDSLIGVGADVSDPSPMLNAIRNGRVKNVKLLLSAGACINREILKEAERFGNSEILGLIYGESRGDISARLESGRQISSFLPSSHTCRL